jgi:hypothetical protein
MTQGFVSNYNDSGYTISGTFYDQNNNELTNYTVSSTDVYKGNPEAGVGVWMIDGGYNSNCNLYRVPFSTTNLPSIGVPADDDNAWLLYPGYGMQLSFNPDYSGTTSFKYYNIGTSPVVLQCDGWTGPGNRIRYAFLNTYPADETNSIRVYFRGEEVQAPSNLTT